MHLIIHRKIKQRLKSQSQRSDFSPYSSLDNYEVCMTKDCVTAASTLIQSMDAEIDPCENFYSFACGGFIDNTNIPQEKHGVSTMSKMQVIFTGAAVKSNFFRDISTFVQSVFQ